MAEKENSSAPTSTPQFTKRRQFLGVKIRSKPIGKLPKPAGPKKSAAGPTTGYNWFMPLLIAVIIVVVTLIVKRDFLLSLLLGAAGYLILSAIEIFNSRRRHGAIDIKSETEKLLSLQYQQAPTRSIYDQQPGQAARPQAQAKKPSNPLEAYLKGVVDRKKDLESELLNLGIKETPFEFARKMFLYAIILTIVIIVPLGLLFYTIGLSPIFALLLGVAVYLALFNRFMLYPTLRARVVGKQVERDILFAARDVVIGMRSGMPLFNAITTVSSGYAGASKEFSKIIELVELGMPIEEAMQEVSQKSSSKTFKRLMLQASVSIRAGVDVTSTLQDVIDEVTQERVIELRRYGQKLNALAMFYMLFGVIFPSMGIAVATIMSTFINIFPVTYVLLIFVLIFIAIVQLILLNIMRNSRPIFVL